MCRDLVDEGDGFGRFGRRRGLGKVEAGGLETVEEKAGAAGVDFVGGDSLEDLGDGELYAGAVDEIGEVETEAASASLARGGVGDRAARGVVVVAEFFRAKAGAAAAMAVGKDVAALKAGVLLRVVLVFVVAGGEVAARHGWVLSVMER
jgi:hypothetical protein